MAWPARAVGLGVSSFRKRASLSPLPPRISTESQMQSYAKGAIFQQLIENAEALPMVHCSATRTYQLPSSWWPFSPLQLAI